MEAFNTYHTASTKEDQPASLQQPENGCGLGTTTQIGFEGQEITTLLTGPKPIEKLGKLEAFVVF